MDECSFYNPNDMVPIKNHLKMFMESRAQMFDVDQMGMRVGKLEFPFMF